MSSEPIGYTKTTHRPDPRLAESWCREGVTHDHGACGDLWDSTSRRDTFDAVRWADEQRTPWSLNVPEVPAHVTAVEDKVGWVWVRDGIVWLLWHGSAGTGAYRIHESELVTRMPLAETDDPRKGKP
jgi:hypothetical protein